MNIIRELHSITYNKNKFQKFFDLLRAFFVYYIIAIACVVLMLVTDKIITKIFYHQSIFHTHFNTDEYIEVIGVYKTALLITIIAPIIEETSFRLFLKPTRLNISLSMSFLLFMISGPICFFGTLDNYVVRIGICGTIFAISYLFYNSNWTFSLNTIQNKLLIYSSLCFSLSHIYNFSPIHWKLFFLYPIYVSPQFFLGYIAGFIRIRNGFVWSVLLHILVNGSSVWPKLF